MQEVTYISENTMHDASESMVSVDNDAVDINCENSSIKANDNQTPEKGRVWRRRNTAVCSKQSEGPVLRATVKPVKRFQPDLALGGNANQPQLPTVTSQIKQTVSVVLHDLIEDEIKTKPLTVPQDAAQAMVVKKKRVREQWSIDDKIHFFEAVAVHGKDFEAVQKAIAQKHKRKGDDSVIKTKDQVRHLYYRTWTTISKLLGDDVGSGNQASKALQELSAVINYGELCKRFGGYMLKKKEMLKLSELINLGSTSVRIKGKTYRIKTPICKALKKIHDKEVQKSAITESRRVKLPLRVNVDLCPLTMEAWNKVHLLGHNPRIRCNLPMDCHLSQILAHLTKKWKSLSDKMFEVAEYGQLQPTLTSNTSQQHNIPINLRISVPPDMPVKAKIEIHQVLQTKSHCIVSYAMCKMGKRKFCSKSKKKIVKVHEAATDACNSSDEEFSNLEPVSDGEGVIHDATKNGEVTQAPETVQSEVCNVGGVSETSTNNQGVALTTSEVISVHSRSPLTSGNTSLALYPTDGYNTQLEMASPFRETVQVFANGSPTPHCINLESTDSQSSADSALSPKTKDSPLAIESMSVDANSQIPSTDIIEHGGSYLKKEMTLANEVQSTQKKYTEVLIQQQRNGCEHANNNTNNVKATQNFVEPHIEKGSNNYLNYQATNGNSSTLKSWNSETSGDLKIAEIFLMLGKPGHFRLCYDWIEHTTTTNSEPVKAPLSSGVIALLQAASLLRRNKAKESSELKDVTKSPPNAKCTFQHEKKTSHASVQCNILNNVNSLNDTTQAVTNTTTKKNHGRGVSKFTNPVSSSESSFAVPNAPIARRRKIMRTENLLDTNLMDTSPNPDEIRQKVQERNGDVQFRRQIEALNRRRDLYRPQNRSRKSRKPYVVQRAMMPNDGAVRKMMTLSIVSCGTSKVGFAPQAAVTVSQPTEPVSHQIHGDVIMTSKESLSSSPTKGNSSEGEMFGEALGLQISNKETAGSSHYNLVAFAAEQSGVTPSSSSASSVTSSDPPSFLNTNAVSKPTSTAEETIDNELSDEESFQPRPITPSMDSLLDSININSNSVDYQDAVRTLALSLPPLDAHPPSLMTSRPSSPVNPWMNSGVPPPSPCSFATLNTPQRVISDTEDSMDGSTFSPSKRLRLPFLNSDSNSAISFPISLSNDADMDVQLHSMLGENSVDLISKFQDLIQQTSDVHKPEVDKLTSEEVDK